MAPTCVKADDGNPPAASSTAADRVGIWIKGVFYPRSKKRSRQEQEDGNNKNEENLTTNQPPPEQQQQQQHDDNGKNTTTAASNDGHDRENIVEKVGQEDGNAKDEAKEAGNNSATINNAIHDTTTRPACRLVSLAPLVRKVTVDPGTLGLTISNSDENDTTNPYNGVIIQNILPTCSNNLRLKIEIGDHIISINGEPIKTVHDLATKFGGGERRRELGIVSWREYNDNCCDDSNSTNHDNDRRYWSEYAKANTNRNDVHDDLDLSGENQDQGKGDKNDGADVAAASARDENETTPTGGRRTNNKPTRRTEEEDIELSNDIGLLIEHFPPQVRVTLSECFHTDGHGIITCEELIAAANLYKQQQHQQQRQSNNPKDPLMSASETNNKRKADSDGTTKYCGCKTNKCLKKYCICFSSGRTCDESKCKCKDCNNTVEAITAAFQEEQRRTAAAEEARVAAEQEARAAAFRDEFGEDNEPCEFAPLDMEPCSMKKINELITTLKSEVEQYQAAITSHLSVIEQAQGRVQHLRSMKRRKRASSGQCGQCAHSECTNLAQILGGVCTDHGNYYKKVCKFEGCNLRARTGGLCLQHSERVYCSHEGCNNYATKVTFGTDPVCNSHNPEYKIRKRECKVEGCTKWAAGHGVSIYCLYACHCHCSIVIEWYKLTRLFGSGLLRTRWKSAKSYLCV